MKKYMEWGAWGTGVIGILGMFLGIIARLAGGILLNHMWSSYFYVGQGFIILGIFLLLGIIVCKQCEKK
jgi:hypothetical protein